MTTRLVRIALVFIIAVALLVPLPFSFACGPDFSGPPFYAITGPEFSYADYARGKLEILQPSYHHEPLFIAYRDLSGKPFTLEELKAFSEPGNAPVPFATDSWVEAWKAARAKVVSQTGEDQLYDGGYGVARQLDRLDVYVEYYNCLDSAFEYAVQTLGKRVEQFGAQSPVVKDWVTAQDQVFANCSGARGYPPKPKPAIIPAAAHPDDPESIRADRAYQIAAAHFYAGEFAAAQTAFEAIAKDSVSPYNKLAPYLVARVLIRKGTLDTGDEEYDPQALTQAETRLRAVLADKNLEEMHGPASRLLGFVEIRLHREQRFQQLETELSKGGVSKDFRQDLTDYLWLLDHPVLTKTVTLPAESAGQPARKATQPDESTRLKGGDMTDWIFTFQQTDVPAYQHSLQRWNESKSLPWLVAAIAKVSANDRAAAELAAAAAKVAPDSPAYITLAFHRLRLLDQSGNSETARKELDQLLAQPGFVLSLSAKNQIVALRMKEATGLEDFLRFAPRNSDDAERYPNAPASSATPAAENALHFDADASVVFTEKLPLRMLADAAKSTTLPKDLRREIAVAAWTRAVILNNDAVARELVSTVRELVPETRGDLAAYVEAAEGPPRQFAAVYAILRNPGFRPFVTAGYPRGNLYTVGEPRFDRIDNLRDNWWCAPAANPKNQTWGPDYYRMFINLSGPLREIYPDGQIPSPAFLSVDDRTVAERERGVLDAQPAAPNWLGKRALEWATSHADDPRVPEALHLVVRARRYGCADSTSENYSKAAFALLHQRYPDSEWAKRTPYWFE
jgi:hypothetical protein